MDLYDPENPVVVLRLSRRAAQALADGEVSEAVRSQLRSTEIKLQYNLSHTAGILRREGEALIEKANRLRDSGEK